MIINDSCAFEESTVIYYNESQPYFSSQVVDEYTGETLIKSYDEISSELLMGKGPVFYFDCSEENDCNLDIADDT